MRILFVSNHYPPYEVGGYEQLCRDVAERLLARGHDIRVLTSDYVTGDRPCDDPPYVYRQLRLHIRYGVSVTAPWQFLWRRRRAEIYDRRTLKAHVTAFAPDVVFIWNLQELPRSLATAAEALPGTSVAYWLAGYTPAEPDEYWLYWAARGRTQRAEMLKALFRRPAMALLRREGCPSRPAMRHVAVVSEYMRRKGLAEGTLPSHARVIYNGVEVEDFYKPICRQGQGPLRVLVAGRVSADKGIHTAVEALGLLARDGVDSVSLAVAGSGPAAYLVSLRDMVRRYDIEDRVFFLGQLPRENMPQVMHSSDVLLLPTIHQEPFARVVLEAMAAGLVVIGTPTGGTEELLQHDVTGLLFPAGDARALASQIERLALDVDLRLRLAGRGQQIVMSGYTMDRMLDDLEVFLAGACAGQDRREI